MNAITETPTQVYRIYIKATPERIWEAMTKPEFTSRYLGGVVEVENGRWRERAPDGSLWHDDLIIESDPPRRLVHEWRSLRARELAEEEPSRVTWELEPQEGGVTKVTVVHDRLEAAPKTGASVADGWPRALSGLKTLLETGRPLAETGEGA
jgi:uncharacterized protein YndB with AHSA1/START domain